MLIEIPNADNIVVLVGKERVIIFASNIDKMPQHTDAAFIRVIRQEVFELRTLCFLERLLLPDWQVLPHEFVGTRKRQVSIILQAIGHFSVKKITRFCALIRIPNVLVSAADSDIGTRQMSEFLIRRDPQFLTVLS